MELTDFSMLQCAFYSSSYDRVKAFFDDIGLDRDVLPEKLIQQWESWKEKMKKLTSVKKYTDDWPDLSTLAELEDWVIRVAMMKLKLHEDWEPVNVRLKELRDIAREWLWRKKEKKADKEENFVPFTNFVISDVWEWKDASY